MNKDTFDLLAHLNTSSLVASRLKVDYYKSKVESYNVAYFTAENDLQTAKNNLTYYIKNRDYYIDQIKTANRTLNYYKAVISQRKFKDVLNEDDIDKYIKKTTSDINKFKAQKQLYIEKISEANNALDEAKAKFNMAKAQRQIAYNYLNVALNEELNEMGMILNIVNGANPNNAKLTQIDLMEFIEFRINNIEDKLALYGDNYEL